MKSAQKTKKGSTQKFTGIADIVEEVVLLDNGNACSIIEIQASNFALLSGEEQSAKIYAYASFLNSLSFPIQVVIRNRKIDISSYINLLNQQTKDSTVIHGNISEEQNQALLNQIRMYRDFIQELIKVNTVLDKNFYMIVPYSYLEKGATAAAGQLKASARNSFFIQAQAALKTKADSVLSQLSRLSLRAQVLQKDQLVTLFYDIYNPNNPASHNLTESINATAIRAQQKL